MNKKVILMILDGWGKSTEPNIMIKKNQLKKSWPTKDAMVQIYENNLWGGNQSDFFSGDGSHDPELIKPYLETVTSFLTAFLYFTLVPTLVTHSALQTLLSIAW